MYVIGLTGGIGSGKSTVADMFQSKGAALVDTDLIAHQISAPGQAGTEAVADLFGRDYLDANGAINRPRLRQLVFNDSDAKKRLEQALHPLIRQEALRQLAALQPGTPYALLAVPLLFETGAYADTIARALVVDCSEATQIHRVMQRSGLDKDGVLKIMASQMSRAERLKRADDVIVNEGDMAQLMENVEKLHEKYVQAHEKE